jgi:hypothetical protein
MSAPTTPKKYKRRLPPARTSVFFGLPKSTPVRHAQEKEKVFAQSHGIHCRSGRLVVRDERCCFVEIPISSLPANPRVSSYAFVMLAVLRVTLMVTFVVTPHLIDSAAEVGAVDQARLKLGPTEFLTKSRGSLQDSASRVVRMLNAVIVSTEETEHAA